MTSQLWGCPLGSENPEGATISESQERQRGSQEFLLLKPRVPQDSASHRVTQQSRKNQDLALEKSQPRLTADTQNSATHVKALDAKKV